MSHDDEHKELTAEEESRQPIYEVNQDLQDEFDKICELLAKARDAAANLQDRVNTQELVTYYADLNAIAILANKATEIAEECYEAIRDQVEAEPPSLDEEKEYA